MTAREQVLAVYPMAVCIKGYNGYRVRIEQYGKLLTWFYPTSKQAWQSAADKIKEERK